MNDAYGEVDLNLNSPSPSFLSSFLSSFLPSFLPSFPSLSFLLAVDCGSLPTPRNGSTHGSATTFPQKVHFKCDNGFDLLGSSVRECQANRTWSGKKANCKGNSKCYVIWEIFLNCFLLLFKIWAVSLQSVINALKNSGLLCI